MQADKDNSELEDTHNLKSKTRCTRVIMEPRKFTIQVIKSSEGGYTGRCMELPAAISEGDTMKQLEANMKETVQLVLESIEEKIKSYKKIIIEIPN